LTTDGSGNWTLDLNGLATPLGDGSYDVVVNTSDAAGNSSSDATSNQLTVDSTPPATPTVDPKTSTDGLPVITGTWDESNATGLEITVDGVTYVLGVDSELTTDGSGNWTLDLSGLATPLGDGSYDVVVNTSDGAGNSSSDATSNQLTVDSTPPATPTVDPKTSTDGLPVITGTWDEADATELEVTVDGVTYVLGVDSELTTDGSGNWTLDLSGLATPLSDGSYDVVVNTSDGAGNSASDTSTNELTVDSTPPAAPTVDPTTSTDGLPVITGTWDEANATELEVTVDGVTYVLGVDSELTTDGSGNWTLDLSGLATPLSDGIYDVVVNTSDGAGNSASDTSTNELTVDSMPPAAPTVDPTTSTDGLPVITGTWDEANATELEVTVDGVTYVLGVDSELTTDGSGNWTLDLSGLATPLSDGSYDVVVNTSDAAGNSASDTSTNELTVDSSSLATPTVNTLTSTDGLPVITGTWDEANATELEVTVNGVTYVLGVDSELTTDGSGNWTLDLSGLATPLSDGIYDVVVNTADGSGNSASDTSTNELTVDSSSLATPTVNTLTSTDGLPVITGTWDEANATELEVTVNGVTYVLGVDSELTTDGSGNWTLDLSGLGTPLSDGTYDVVVNTSDGAGNSTSDTTTNELTVRLDDVSPKQSDIGIKKSVSTGPYLVGNNIVYTILVENYGPDKASDIVVFDEISLDLRYVSSIASRGNFDKITGEWRLDSMTLGRIDTLIIEVEILTSGIIENEAEVYAAEIDPNPNNNISELVSINVTDAFEVSPGFSPDGDGINDVWQIKGIRNYPNNKVKIFNRWGNLVFEIDGYNNEDRGWQGEVKSRIVISGTEVPDGTYFYLIDLGDGSKPLNGYITLIR
jgi:gliding motility-associated-like protein